MEVKKIDDTQITNAIDLICKLFYNLRLPIILKKELSRFRILLRTKRSSKH